MTEYADYIELDPEHDYEIDPEKNFFRLACCDCGLVHNFTFKISKGKTLRINLYVDEDETDRLRENKDTGIQKSQVEGWEIKKC